MRLVAVFALLFAAACASSTTEDTAAVDGALSSSGADSFLATARKAGLVGEQIDGYVGVIDEANASRETKRGVDDVNIRRRALYTKISVEQHMTVQQVAQSFACELYREHIGIGEMYEAVDGAWTKRSWEPIVLPSFCGATAAP